MKTQTISAIVTRRNGRVLLEGNALPQLEGNPDFLEAARRLSLLLGSEVAPLHQDSRYLFPDNPARQVWVFESLAPERVPVPFAWYGVETLELVSVAVHRTALEVHFTELEVVPAHRQAWQRVGWLEGARVWLKSQLPNATPLEIQSSWHGSLNAVSSVNGRGLHFKALPKSLAREMRLVPWLRGFESAVPQVAAVSEAQAWIVTWSAGDTALIRDGNADHWCEALRKLATLQIAMLPHRAKLEALGCQTLTPKDALVETRAILEERDLEHAALALKQLEGMPEKLERLAALGLPLALCHGDFHPMNLIAPATIIDWSDAMIAHPFVDLERFLRWIMGTNQPHPWSPFTDARALEREFINAYLEPWSAFAPLETLHQTFLETRPFGFVALIAQHGRLERQQGVKDSRLTRSLLPYYARQLATFAPASP